MTLKKSILMMTTAFMLGTIFIAYSVAATITTGGQEIAAVDTQIQETVPVKILADYRAQGFSGVLDLGTYTYVDDAKNLNYYNRRYDKNANAAEMKKACTAYFKEMSENGKQSVMMGRNMDLPNSPYPAYVFRINEPGKYKSVNFGYSGVGMETYAQIAQEGKIIKEMYDVFPYVATDSMNEKGLIIETNMRDGTDVVKVTGTNPGKLRIAAPMVNRYLSDRAATIEEALNLLNELDVYTPNNHTNWHFSLAMMDATGRYGVLEFVNNKPVWHDGQKGQANFWLDKKIFDATDNNLGMARFEYMQKVDPAIHNSQDMLKALEGVYYGQLYSVEADKMGFDSRSEETSADVRDFLNKIKGWQTEYGIQVEPSEWAVVEQLAKDHPKPLETSFCLDPKNKQAIDTLTNLITHSLMQLPPEVRQSTGLQEVSVFSYAVDNQERVYHVRFFEQPEVFDLPVEDK